jgi:sec-independent protein translocase protein TatA
MASPHAPAKALPSGAARSTVWHLSDGLRPRPRSSQSTMPNIGFPELIVILLILVLVFGASRLPALGEGMGKAIRSFKRGVAQDENIEISEVKSETKPESKSEPKRVPSEHRSSDNITDAEIIDEKKS